MDGSFVQTTDVESRDGFFARVSVGDVLIPVAGGRSDYFLVKAIAVQGTCRALFCAHGIMSPGTPVTETVLAELLRRGPDGDHMVLDGLITAEFLERGDFSLIQAIPPQAAEDCVRVQGPRMILREYSECGVRFSVGNMVVALSESHQDVYEFLGFATAIGCTTGLVRAVTYSKGRPVLTEYRAINLMQVAVGLASQKYGAVQGHEPCLDL